MKKLCISLAILFVLLFSVSIYTNAMRGLTLGGTFWRCSKDGIYHANGDWIRPEGDGKLRLCLDETEYTASCTQLADGRYRLDFSGGWSVETTDDASLCLTSDGLIWFGGAELIITDLSALGLQFEPLSETLREPFFDENGKQVGEMISLISLSGATIDNWEEWYGETDPCLHSGRRETMVLQNGVRLNTGNLYEKLFVNPDGEYLIYPDELRRIRAGDRPVTRENLAALLLEASRGESDRRGEFLYVLYFALFYLTGAATLLWPEKVAFFGSRWQYKNPPELSEAGLRSSRVCGALLILMSIFSLFVPLV